MNTTKEEKTAKTELIDKCAIYLNENFHKFTQTNKIKIALEIFKRGVSTQLEHSGKVDTDTKIVIIYPPGYKPKEEIGNQSQAVSSRIPGLTS